MYANVRAQSIYRPSIFSGNWDSMQFLGFEEKNCVRENQNLLKSHQSSASADADEFF